MRGGRGAAGHAVMDKCPTGTDPLPRYENQASNSHGTEHTAKHDNDRDNAIVVERDFHSAHERTPCKPVLKPRAKRESGES